MTVHTKVHMANNHRPALTATIRLEQGYGISLEGLSYNRNQPIENMPGLAERLAPKGQGHNKFLRQIQVWIEVTAPRYWWQEYATYKVGTVEQSESTMNTLTKRLLTLDDFVFGVAQESVDVVNRFIEAKDLVSAKRNLPEGFLQRRMCLTNYEGLRNLILQRKNHRLEEWRMFIHQIVLQLKNPELLPIEDLAP